jgi:hypothetical protein
MKRVLLPLLAAFVAMLVVAAAATGNNGAKGHHSLELAGTEVSFNFVDVDPKQANPQTDAPSPGDSFLSSETITKRGQDFGSVYIQCTWVVADVTQCNATFDLPNGQIAAQNVIHQDIFLAGQGADFSSAVTGGTGDYSGASGTVVIHESGQGTATYAFQFR